MALLLMIVRKMSSNKWLELSLLFGLIVSVALVSSMPMYTDAILQRMLLKDLQKQQNDSGEYPGYVRAFAYYNADETPDQQRDRFLFGDKFMEEQAGAFGIPSKLFERERSTINLSFAPADPTKLDGSVQRTGDITAITDIESHVKLIDGRMPAKQAVDGVYEALVPDRLLTNMKLVLGNELVIKSDDVKETIRVKPVGVIAAKDDRDLYWYHAVTNYSSSFLIDASLFDKDFLQGKKIPVASSSWLYALDYDKIKLSSIQPYLQTVEKTDDYFSNRFNNIDVKANAKKTIETYFDEAKKLRLLLWSLNVPVMILLAFYLFMVSNLITEKQKTEIAVLRSRGASRLQILAAYALEGVLLGAAAYVIGPLLGLGLTQMLGASNGFLEFVQRASLDVHLSGEAYKYALAAVAGSVIMTMIPIVLATRVSIVSHKQQLARRERGSIWHRFGIDVLLMGVAIYGWFSFGRRMRDLQALGLNSIDFKVDPLLFVVPALFILAVGLLALRLYPWFVRAVYAAGRRWWPPSLYATMIQVGRSTVQYQFIMVFLILTVATGLYSASAARTINQNAEDKIRYEGGADIRLQIEWQNDAPPPAAGGPGGPGGSPDAGAADMAPPKRIQYTEPPFLPFTQLPGVEHAAKVFKKEGAFLAAGKANAAITLMGIDTNDFGNTTWMKSGLLSHPINAYLNLIAADPTAVLISKSIADQYGVKPGDHITLGWNGIDGAQFNVYGIINYWPSWNPNPDYGETGSSSGNNKAKPKSPNLVVGNLQYIQNNLAMEPYDVWLKLKPGTSEKELYDAMAKQNLNITALQDTHQKLIESKNDPFRLAVNGVMTLGFVISTAISFIGFLLYWVLSLSGRTLQFGILRAMGISFLQLLGMLAAEQIMTSGAAVVIGAATGQAASRLFVPFFQLSFDTVSQVPPFRVTFDPSDSLKLYTIIAFMIVIGIVLLGVLLSRIRIHQAVKLGED